jgi:hypothetical protein
VPLAAAQGGARGGGGLGEAVVATRGDVVGV